MGFFLDRTKKATATGTKQSNESNDGKKIQVYFRGCRGKEKKMDFKLERESDTANLIGWLFK